MAQVYDFQTDRRIHSLVSDQVAEWQACNRYGQYRLVSRVVFDDGSQRVVDYSEPFYTGKCELIRDGMIRIDGRWRHLSTI